MSDSNPIQTVNVAVTNVFNGVLREENPPIYPWGNSFLPIGAPTTPGLSRGQLANTGVHFTNTDLSHACDARFILNGNFSLTELSLPNLGILAAGIQNGKMAAAKAIQVAMATLIGEFRISIKAILITLNADPSGESSRIFSVLKKKTREINEKLKTASQMLTNISFVYYMIQDLEQIVQWIESLPAKFLAIVKDCLTNFNKSLSSVKDQITGTLSATQTSLTQSLNSAISASQTSIGTDAAGVSPSLLSATTDPLNASSSAIATTISGSTSQASSYFAQTQSALQATASKL